MMEGQNPLVLFTSQQCLGPGGPVDTSQLGEENGLVVTGFHSVVAPSPLQEAFSFVEPAAQQQHHQAVPPLITVPAELKANGSTTVTEAEMEVEEKREHKKRSKNWTRPETLKLIRLRTELEPRFAKTGRKTELWDEIAEALQKERFCRDAQQCRDKWEKLTAGYKEVRDGVKDREDNPFYDELYPLLSGKLLKRDCGKAPVTPGAREREMFCMESGAETFQEAAPAPMSKELDTEAAATGSRAREEEDEDEGRTPLKKKRRLPKYIAVTDVAAVQNLVETVIAKQQRFFRDLLESMERKEQIREQIRVEREERWRAEERAQRQVFNNAIITLTQKLVGEKLGVPAESLVLPQQAGSPEGANGGQGVPKKRSKNWKRTEVLQLIKLRGEMEIRFARSTRRAALWDELADALKSQGIKRDGKQCREKWDKLMAEFKDVADGKREQTESHYYSELAAIIPKHPPEAP